MLYIMSFLLFSRIGKPEGLTAASVVTEDHFSSLVLFNETEPAPAGTPCGKQAVSAFMSITDTSEFRWSATISTGIRDHVMGIRCVTFQKSSFPLSFRLNLQSRWGVSVVYWNTW